MYLPTFWKLTTEATMYRGRHLGGWLLPATCMVAWIGFPSFYNWTYSTIIPPPTGVAKQWKWSHEVFDAVFWLALILNYGTPYLNLFKRSLLWLTSKFARLSKRACPFVSELSIQLAWNKYFRKGLRILNSTEVWCHGLVIVKVANLIINRDGSIFSFTILIFSIHPWGFGHSILVWQDAVCKWCEDKELWLESRSIHQDEQLCRR